MIKAWKLFHKRKDGTLGPLFINRRQRIEVNKWLPAEAHKTKGFAFRPGWHCTFAPHAPHIRTDVSDRVWVEVLVRDYDTYPRPESQGGTWILAKEMMVIGDSYANV